MTPHRVLFSGRARRELARVAEWWRENRRDALDLLGVELTETLGKIAHAPRTGVELNHRGIRRALLHRCRYHIYYSIDHATRTVTIRAVWHATRGQGPSLK